MKPINFIQKCVTIRKDQDDFLMGERRGFKLSKFLQHKLDDYIKERKEYKEFIKKEEINGKES